MNIIIDGKAAELFPGTSVPMSLKTGCLDRADAQLISFDAPFDIPVTPHNRSIMGDVDGIGCIDRFNRKDHSIAIEKDGVTVAQGNVILKSVSHQENATARYTCLIVSKPNGWVEATSGLLLHETGIEFACTADRATVAQSWTWDEPVRFLPVARKGFEVANVNSSLFAPSRVLCFEDYHPFINLGALIGEIFARSGYSIRSGFLDSEFFRSLYMSGNYPGRSVGALKAGMDFRAGRFGDGTAVADRLGRVYANPAIDYNSIGNIVDTANPFDTKDGITVSGVFSNGGCLTHIDGQLAFKPTQEVTVAFEFDLKYRSDYYIASRTELLCFNKIYFGQEDVREFEVANRNADRRDSFHEGHAYTMIVFGHEPGNKYKLMYDRITNPAADPANLKPGDITTYASAVLSARAGSVSIAAGPKAINPRLTVQYAGSGEYLPYGDDWALYDGYVTETGSIEIEATVRTKPKPVAPGSPGFFYMIYFGGAEPDMGFTLYRQTTMRPVFTTSVGEGSDVEFKDVAAHKVRQSDVIDAVKQMFNLKFFTDNQNKTVYVEPGDDILSGNKVIDWSGKIDSGKPVIVEELGGELSKTVSLLYKDGDTPTAEYNVANGTKLGKWSFETEDRQATGGNRAITNPLFTTAMNGKGKYPDAPSASMLTVGDNSTDTSNDLNFAPRIVRYAGLKQLGGAEQWGWPEPGNHYPHLAFFDPDNDVSLCFEDRAAEGLHRFYDRSFATQTEGRRITLYLDLRPEDVERVAVFDEDGGDFRSQFRLCVDGENFLARLESIEGYDPAKDGSTKCVFIKC